MYGTDNTRLGPGGHGMNIPRKRKERRGITGMERCVSREETLEIESAGGETTGVEN